MKNLHNINQNFAHRGYSNIILSILYAHRTNTFYGNIYIQDNGVLFDNYLCNMSAHLHRWESAGSPAFDKEWYPYKEFIDQRSDATK